MSFVIVVTALDAPSAISLSAELVAGSQGFSLSALEIKAVISSQGEADQQVEYSDEDTGIITFSFSSHFLLQCWRFLMTVPEEQLIPISGMPMPGSYRVATAFCKVDYKASSECGVDADPRSTHECLREMDAFGHQLVAAFHSHPGCGVRGVTPSVTDHVAQKRYQSLGYEAISGIFSRDGYIRFFAEEELNFRIKIQGTGVEEVEENVYRLNVASEESSVQTAEVV